MVVPRLSALEPITSSITCSLALNTPNWRSIASTKWSCRDRRERRSRDLVCLGVSSCGGCLKSATQPPQVRPRVKTTLAVAREHSKRSCADEAKYFGTCSRIAEARKSDSSKATLELNQHERSNSIHDGSGPDVCRFDPDRDRSSVVDPVVGGRSERDLNPSRITENQIHIP
jgi:hypothetical protein